MTRKFFKKIGILFLLICMIYSSINQFTFTIYAEEEYSEEEKAAAKAWLSSHGYSPTRSGAEQAYQDYLNGKFDDDPQVQAAAKANNQETSPSTSQEDQTDSSKKQKKKAANKTNINTNSSTQETAKQTTTKINNTETFSQSSKKTTKTVSVKNTTQELETMDLEDIKQQDQKNMKKPMISYFKYLALGFIFLIAITIIVYFRKKKR